MGLTNFSVELLDRHINSVPTKTVLELGAQNLYHSDYPGAPYANVYYEARGFKYTCVDLNGENGAKKLNLALVFDIGKFGLVTDFGTSEHVAPEGKHDTKAFYKCWVNKHNACEVGGLIISENPKTGHWPGHGFNYVDMEFYHSLCHHVGYEWLGIGEVAAMGNDKDGMNIYCVLRKVNDNPFIGFDEFKKLPFYTK